MNILVPQGIGDSIWCLFKAQDLASHYDNKINIRIAVWHMNTMEARAMHFLKRFSFVNSVELYQMPRNGNHGPVLLPGPPADKDGYYRYIPDGNKHKYPGIDYVMIPNAALERGIRLENWLPSLKTNWDIMNEFRWTDAEKDFAKQFKENIGEYIVFFMASEASNTTAGHNRNALWKPKDWVELGQKFHMQYGCKIVVVGTTWDEDYYYKSIQPLITEQHFWINCISQWEIGQTYAICNESRFLVCYQSGIGIVSHYLGKPLVIFWRPKGDSISPNEYVSFEEDMATAWANPKYLADGRLMPCIYGRHKTQDILNYAIDHKW